MVFSSATFLLLFMPLSLLVYYAIPVKGRFASKGRGARNVVLLLFSLVFYAWGEPTYIILMIVSIIVNWASGIIIERASKTSSKRTWLVINLVINLAVLGFFKYANFAISNVNAIFGTSIASLDLSLPIGISFYTLQGISYIIDVYRGEVPAQRNVLYLGMYIAMFPQLVAGPIVRYATIQDQVLHRVESVRLFADGVRLFIVGLAKKVLLANIVAILATKMLGEDPSAIGVVGAWGGILAYTFQIYFDFAGYSDMAIGLGKMFGFTYLRNFNYPYISKSATEFWRRWHISLSSFFRDYIYIPMGGSRCSRPRWVLNIFTVWALTGLWHGAAWNFVLWGLFYGVLLVCEKYFILRFINKLPSFFQHVYGILCFMFGWLIFWIEDMGQLGHYLMAMFGAYGATGTSTFWELTVWEYVPVFIACAIASTPIVPWIRYKLTGWLEGRHVTNFLENDLPYYKRLGTEGLCTFEVSRESLAASGSHRMVYEVVATLVDVLLVALLVISVMSVISGSFNPFIYFRF